MQRQYLWNTPDGDHPDFSETYTHGDEILISWNALNNSIYDLWLTNWGFDADPVALCLASKSSGRDPGPGSQQFTNAANKGAVNLTHDGNLKLMTSDPPSAQLANKTRYVLRFKPPTSQGEYAASDPDLSSPGFVLKMPESFHQQDVPSSGASATATASQTTFRATPSRGIATSVPEEYEAVSDMSPGAAAGLTVGLILVVAFVVAMEVAYLMWRRKRRRQGDSEEEGTQASSQRRLRRLGKGGRGLFVPVAKAEMVIDDAVWMMSPELPGDSTWGQRLVHELQGSRLGRGRKPGQALTINSSVVELEAGR
jgi:hypothetical protein